MISSDSKYNATFPKRFRQLIEEKGVNYTIISNDLSITRQSICKYADGSVLPNIEKLEQFANYFNVSADYLIGLSDLRTRENDTFSFCYYTGLSEDAVDFLREEAEKSFFRSTAPVSAIEELIAAERNSKYQILSDILSYLMYDSYKMNKLKNYFVFSSGDIITTDDYTSDSERFDCKSSELLTQVEGNEVITTVLLKRVTDDLEGIREMIAQRWQSELEKKVKPTRKKKNIPGDTDTEDAGQ